LPTRLLLAGTRTFRKTPVWLVCSLVLLAAVLVMYSHFLVPPYWPKLAGTFDYYRYHGPQAFFIDASIHRGEFPLWNPLSFCGTPFAANPQVSLFYPLNLVRSLLTFAPTPFKTHVGLALMMALHMVIAGVGTFMLARDYRLSRGAGLVAAFAYIFGPHFMRRVLEQWVLAAVATWFPWLLFLLRRSIRAPSWRERVFYGAGAGLVFGVSILAGFPQLTFYTAVALAAFCLIDRLVHLRRTDARAPLGVLRRISRDAVVLALIGVIGAMVAAAALLPALELGGFSARFRGRGFTVNPASQDLSPMHLFRSLIVYPGATREEQGCRAAGLGVLFLAVMAAGHAKKRAVFVYAFFFVFLTDCTLGPPFPFGWAVERLDIFQFSSPWRAGILAGLPLAMLAGLGVDAAAKRSKSWQRDLVRVGVLVGVGAILLWHLAAWQAAEPYVAVSRMVVYLPLATLIALLAAPYLRLPRVWSVLAPALVFIEMLSWNYHFIPYMMEWKGYKGSRDALEGARALPLENRRGIDRRPNESFYALKPVINGYDPVCIGRVRQALCAPQREKRYLRSVKHWEVTADNTRGNLFLKRPFWLAKQYVEGPLPGKGELFPATTTVFLSDPPVLPVPRIERELLSKRPVSGHIEEIPMNVPEASPLVERRDGTRKCRLRLPVIEMPPVHCALRVRYRSACAGLAKAWFYDPTTGEDALGKTYAFGPSRGREGTLEFALPDFSKLKGTLTFETKQARGDVHVADVRLLADQADEDQRITIVGRSVNSVEVEVNGLPEHRILTFVDAAYPGRKAYVDDEPVPILLANQAFKAVVVPPGTHRVRFVFSPRLVYAGTAVSFLAMIAASAFVIWLRPGKTMLAGAASRRFG